MIIGLNQFCKKAGLFFKLILVLNLFFTSINGNYLDLFHPSDAYVDFVKSVFDEYNRPISFLEVCDGSRILCTKFISNPNINCILLVTPDQLDDENLLSQQEISQQLEELKLLNLANLIILKPKSFDFTDLSEFADCESVDVAMFHHLPLKFKMKNYPQFIKSASLMGKEVILDISQRAFDLYFKATKGYIKKLDYQDLEFDTLNRCLILLDGDDRIHRSRWRTKDEIKKNKDDNSEKEGPVSPAKECRRKFKYGVYSYKRSKRFIKTYSNMVGGECLKYQFSDESEWIHGINLTTFTILGGIYPTTEMIVDSLESMQGKQHNDLVMSNFIIKGDGLFLIDEKDQRRNSEKKFDVFLNLLIELYSDPTWLDDTDKIVNDYFNTMRSMLRRNF